MTETENISSRPAEQHGNDAPSASDSAKLVLDQLPWLIRNLREKQMSQTLNDPRCKADRPQTTDAE